MFFDSRAILKKKIAKSKLIQGTPIQNRLEDLGSLIRFLRVVPFDSNATFRTHISDPLLTDPGGDRNLRLLLKSMCLRRTRALLDLPNAEDQTITLSLSTEERSVYSQIIEDTKRNIDDCISRRSITKAYNGIFQAILRLRLLCNNGTQQISNSRSELQEGFAQDEYVVEGERPACIFCSCEIIDSDSQVDDSPGASPQTPLQLLCPACLSPNDTNKTSHQKKPKKQQPTSSRRVQQTKNENNINPRPHSGDRASSTSTPNGHSSKLSALVSNILENTLGNKRYAKLCQILNEEQH